MSSKSSILNLKETPEELTPKSAIERSRDQVRASWNESFGSRSARWWIGAVVGLACYGATLLVIEMETKTVIRPGGTALFALLIGGALGDVLGLRLQRFSEKMSYDPLARVRLRRRVMLVAGVLLFVYNIMPDSPLNHMSEVERKILQYRIAQGRASAADAGGYYWSNGNLLLAAAGAVLVCFALTESKDTRY